MSCKIIKRRNKREETNNEILIRKRMKDDVKYFSLLLLHVRWCHIDITILENTIFFRFPCKPLNLSIVYRWLPWIIFQRCTHIHENTIQLYSSLSSRCCGVQKFTPLHGSLSHCSLATTRRPSCQLYILQILNNSLVSFLDSQPSFSQIFAQILRMILLVRRRLICTHIYF